jgi:hypothetical protein
VAIIKESIIEDARVKLEAKLTKTMSVRMDRENYEFLREIAKEEGSDLSNAVRDTVTRGRILLAVERYRTARLRSARPRN